jgi:hypothetical protein
MPCMLLSHHNRHLRHSHSIVCLLVIRSSFPPTAPSTKPLRSSSENCCHTPRSLTSRWRQRRCDLPPPHHHRLTWHAPAGTHAHAHTHRHTHARAHTTHTHTHTRTHIHSLITRSVVPCSLLLCRSCSRHSTRSTTVGRATVPSRARAAARRTTRMREGTDTAVWGVGASSAPTNKLYSLFG